MGGAIYEMRAVQTMVCAIVEAQGEGSGEGEEITVPIFSSSPLNCRRLRFSGGGKTVEGGGKWCVYEDVTQMRRIIVI